MNPPPSIGQRILFVILAMLSSFFLGLLLSPLFISKDAGLAAGAMVVFYGAAAGLAGLVLGLFLQNRISKKAMVRASGVLAVYCLGFGAWAGYRVNSTLDGQKRETTQGPAPLTPTAEAPDLTSNQYLHLEEGIGMAKSILTEGSVIRFYPAPDQRLQPENTLQWVKGPAHLVPRGNPDWFSPEIQKLDYDLCYFRVTDSSGPFFQVEVNRVGGQKAWVNEGDIQFLKWEDFLMTVHSIEPLYPDRTTFHQNPDPKSPTFEKLEEDGILQPLGIYRDWIELKILDADYREKGSGWVRWHNGEKLLVRYYLLS